MAPDSVSESEAKASPLRVAADALVLAAIVLLLAVGLSGLLVTTSFRVIDSVFGLRIPVLIVAAGMLIAWSMLSTWRASARAVAGFLGVAGVLVALLVAGLAEVFGTNLSEIDVVPSPAGDRRAVVSEGTYIVDVLYVVQVRAGEGILEREWTVDCTPSDQPDYDITIDWVNESQFRVQAPNESFVVELEPATGRPVSGGRRDYC